MKNSKTKLILIGALLFVGGCLGTYTMDEEVFYKSDEFWTNTDVTQIRLQGSACIKEVQDEFGTSVDVKVTELPMRACVPYLVAQAVKERFGACEPNSFVLERDEFGTDVDSSTLILNQDCLCFIEIRDEFGTSVDITRKFASLDQCNRFFGPEEFSTVRLIAEEIANKYR